MIKKYAFLVFCSVFTTYAIDDLVADDSLNDMKVGNGGSILISNGTISVSSNYVSISGNSSLQGRAIFAPIVDVTPAEIVIKNLCWTRYIQLIYGTWNVYNAKSPGHGIGQSTNGVYMIDRIYTGQWSGNGNEFFKQKTRDDPQIIFGSSTTPPSSSADVSLYYLDYVQYSNDNQKTWHTCLKGSWHVTGSGSVPPVGNAPAGGATSVLDSDFAPSTEEPNLSGGQYLFGKNPPTYNF